ncbi:P-loop containing nucleoside triphosphate hydrolase protein [Gorgonomyces haynaldii]|nr:P-loop containing nucleoside triphosphate hydrolase protein [Gorgonomyces haynaldii]
MTELRQKIQNQQDPTMTLYQAFFKYLSQHFSLDQFGGNLKEIIETTDLTRPEMWFPETRKMKRRIIMHVGPTNSGKTYQALKRFAEAENGVYCGPLRLLAFEVYERMNDQGVECNLLTGEERRESDGVYKWSSTIEMANLSRVYKVAVIDEIQMISDPQRGWAWTEAVLGLQAEEIHLCGEATAVDLVKKLCQTTGETVIVNEYKRLTGLQVAQKSLGKLSNLRPGDAIVTFSRRNIFAIKNMIEKGTNLRTAVIYGSLPPETRAVQAKLFNEQDKDHQILVASDAIGMGLNLNIRRVILDSLEKFDGQRQRSLSISQVKQIAGRAGRYGTKWEDGIVTTMEPKDFKKLKTVMEMNAPKLKIAGLSPRIEQLQEFSRVLKTDSLSELLTQFQQVTQVGGNYFLCNLDAQMEVAQAIEDLDLSLRDKFVFVNAPCNMRDEKAKKCLLSFAESYSRGQSVDLEQFLIPNDPVPTKEALYLLEVQHRIIMLYLWLAQRFPSSFDQPSDALFHKHECERAIEKSLERFGRKFRLEEEEESQDIRY